MWVKICANTNLEDALAATELGADALGFVFAPSKRQVTAQQVRAIADQLPPTVERIGVFAHFSAAQIAAAVEAAHLTGVQLHDGFHADVTEALHTLLPTSIRIIETAHWRVGDDKEAAHQAAHQVAQQLAAVAAHPSAQRVLIDAKVGQVSGGTGTTFDWAAAAPAFASQPRLQFILAGGLRPENVAEAIHALHPWGIDIASGVESIPGRKDHARLAAFIKNARQA